MESLRPDREDLDQFKKRNIKTQKSVEGQNKIKVEKRVRSERQSSGLLTWFMLLVIVLGGFFAWFYIEQQSKLLALEEELQGASDFIGRSELLMARFEGELNTTGTEIEQSGSVVQKKLAFLDGEMRKLWVVSNERNKKAIKANADSYISLKEELSVLKQWRKDFEVANKKSKIKQEATISSLSLQSTVLQGEVENLKGRVLLMANEATILREEQEETVGELKVGVKQIESLSKQLAESKKAISSIDASRLQLNERVVSLERIINKLQLNIKNNTKASDVQ